MFVDVHGFPNIYNDIGNIFIDEHIANVTAIYKTCKDEIKAKRDFISILITQK